MIFTSVQFILKKFISLLRSTTLLGFLQLSTENEYMNLQGQDGEAAKPFLGPVQASIMFVQQRHYC